MTDYKAAIDSIFALFMAYWNANSTDILDEAPAIYWQGIEEAAKPDSSKYWIRISQQTIEEVQKSFTAENSRKRFQISGLVFVQLFCPKTDSQAFNNGRQLAVVARNAFRGNKTSAGVWFRNAVIKELSSEESYHRFNIVVEYQYDEME